MESRKLNLAATILVTTVWALATSCSSGGGNFEKSKQLITKHELNVLSGDKTNKGKRFSVVGYPAFTGDISISNSRTPVLSVYTEPEGKGDLVISFSIELGKSRNEVYVPEEFTIKDIALYDNDGVAHKYNEKMQFSFTLNLQTNLERHSVMEMKIVDGKLQTESIKGYLQRIEDVRIDKA
ncbi:MAG: hypothetical protein JWR38_5358 [Mucilaginibacter sp.]|nr:hypothetical protein [Mucilaginibacter sp.]